MKSFSLIAQCVILSSAVFVIGASPAVRPADANRVDPPAAADAAPYKAEMDRVYRLEKGHVLKRVPRPFIPQRMLWYRAEHAHQAQAIPRGPDYVVFDFTDAGGLRHWGMGFGFEKMPLRTVVDNALRLRTYEYDGPDNLLGLDLAGDWVVRTDAPIEQKLDALARLVKEVHGRNVRFEKRELPREVIVAGGTWKFTPLGGTYNDKWVHLFAGKQDDSEGSGGGSGDLTEFLQMLGSRVGSPVVDEVAGDRPRMFTWGHHNSSRLHNLPVGPERLEKLASLLDVVSKQTGLTLELARRKVPVWVLIEVKPEA